MDRTYTEEDLQSRVANELIKQRMGDMERKLEEGERRTAASLADIKNQIEATSALITSQSTAMKKSTDDLRDEMKHDFASKEDLNSKFKQLDTKIDTQWSKLVLIVSVVTLTGSVVSAIVSLIFQALKGG